METTTRHIYSFADFELEAAARSLKKNGNPIFLNAKAFDLLVFLVENAERIVSKDEILDKVWEGQLVEENNLTVQMSALRKALGESPNEPHFLMTIPGKGYKFIAPVQLLGDELLVEADQKTGNLNGDGATELKKTEIIASHPESSEQILTPEITTQNVKIPTSSTSFDGNRTLSKLRNQYLLATVFILLIGLLIYLVFFPKTPRAIESVAVLPLVNVGGDPKMGYLSDGITENLINDLSQSSNLKVIARSSVFRYRVNEEQAAQQNLTSIAQELGVQAVLTGRVEKRGDDLLISVELVDGTNNTNLWGASYNRKFAEVFAVQEEIARDISGKLRLKLTGEGRQEFARRYTDNIKAYENYQMGRAYVHRRTREDLLTALRYYQEAIKDDPNYALAYTGIAEAYGNLGVRGYMPMVEGRQKLGDAARKALELDDQLAESHAMMGYYYMGFAPYNFPAAEKELRRAIEISPSLAIAHLYLSLSLIRHDQLDEGAAEMLKAHELDPFSAIISHQRTLCFYLKRDFTRAMEIIRQADQLGPSFTTSTESSIYIKNGALKEGLDNIERESQKRKDDAILISGKGMIYAAQGKRAEALSIIKELESLSNTDFKQAQWIAKIYLLLGEKEEALRWLERGVTADSMGAFYKDDVLWDSIRNDSRFAGLLRLMGVPSA